jgi:hypothetical protein
VVGPMIRAPRHRRVLETCSEDEDDPCHLTAAAGR